MYLSAYPPTTLPGRFLFPVPHPTWQCLHKVKWSHRNGTACIIISPTRELSLQTYGVLRDVIEAGNIKQSHGLLIGGANRRGSFVLRLSFRCFEL